MKMHVEDVIIKHADPQNDMYVEMRNPRLPASEGPEITLQDVIRVHRILNEHQFQIPITFNTNLWNPIKITFFGGTLQQEVSGITLLNSHIACLYALADYFEVTVYFEKSDKVYVLDQHLNCTEAKRGIA